MQRSRAGPCPSEGATALTGVAVPAVSGAARGAVGRRAKRAKGGVGRRACSMIGEVTVPPPRPTAPDAIPATVHETRRVHQNNRPHRSHMRSVDTGAHDSMQMRQSRPATEETRHSARVARQHQRRGERGTASPWMRGGQPGRHAHARRTPSRNGRGRRAPLWPVVDGEPRPLHVAGGERVAEPLLVPEVSAAAQAAAAPLRHKGHTAQQSTVCQRCRRQTSGRRRARGGPAGY